MGSSNSSRGKIRNRKHATQVRDFHGLRYGTITPTDIDGLLDFGNKVFVMIEAKFGDSPVPKGQRLAIERVVDRLQDSGAHAIGLIARHTSIGDIDVAGCLVTCYRWMKKWYKLASPLTVRRVIDGFLSKHAPEFLNRN